MGTKNIAISDKGILIAQGAQKSLKGRFTDIIEGMKRRCSVLELAELMPKRDVATLERHVKEVRRRSSRRRAHASES